MYATYKLVDASTPKCHFTRSIGHASLGADLLVVGDFALPDTADTHLAHNASDRAAGDMTSPTALGDLAPVEQNIHLPGTERPTVVPTHPADLLLQHAIALRPRRGGLGQIVAPQMTTFAATITRQPHQHHRRTPIWRHVRQPALHTLVP